jgi:DNA-binding transcriptional LysR family regulator
MVSTDGGAGLESALESANLPELRELRYFVAVAEELHFRRAAERLYISQSPLSQAIAKLERALGVQLLERTSRQVALTAAGDAFLEGARLTLAAARDAVDRAQAVADGRMGSLKLGATLACRFAFVATVIYELTPRYPELDVEVTSASLGILLRSLGQGTLDAVFGHEIEPRPWLGLQELRSERIVAVVGPQNPLAARNIVALPELLNQPLVVGPEALYPDGGGLDLFRRRGLVPDVVLHPAAGPDWEREYAARGFSILAESTPHDPAARRLTIADVEDQVTLYLAWNERKRPPALDHVLEAVRSIERSDELERARGGDGFTTPGRPELPVNAAEMGLDRIHRDEEL